MDGTSESSIHGGDSAQSHRVDSSAEAAGLECSDSASPACTSDLPAMLYKYVGVDGVFKCLCDTHLQWSSPLAFNDPFDGQWDVLWQLREGDGHGAMFRRIVETIMRRVTPPEGCDPRFLSKLLSFADAIAHLDDDTKAHQAEEFAANVLAQVNNGPRFLTDFRECLRVCCFSQACDHMLMWSHYSEMHRGFVLGFNAKILEATWRVRARPVQYCKQLPEIESLGELVDHLVFGKPYEGIPFGPEEVANVKANQWSYEMEWRFVTLRNSSESGLKSVRAFPPSALEMVIAGCRSEVADRHRVFRMARRANPFVKLARAERDHANFAVRITELDGGLI